MNVVTTSIFPPISCMKYDISEHKHRHLFETARCLMHQSSLSAAVLNKLGPLHLVDLSFCSLP
jgi:hypothetical protein